MRWSSNDAGKPNTSRNLLEPWKLDRGKEQLDRGKEQLDRGKEQRTRGKEQHTRGKEQIDRGKPQVDQGGPTQVAADVFQRAAGLGGHLIVAFIAPVGASNQETASSPADSSGPLDKESATAVADRLIAQAMLHWSATPGGPKAQPTTYRKAQASKRPVYKEPGKSSGGKVTPS